ncbi:HNH endonuclease [Parasphingorhabdus halotolerans]|uniref:HNH endonuclease n=1 Tax=Parasphingorhabdus halotolerans TaxID=2725558 RepID=A0A6H2DHY2_9SPHN|nr:HNH endonuclease signature motif containing protein [Parasphingorhabdus halotolerans]QJB68279.1 HNH endonuclease [Parasphingorhabdus halotolerans]
MKTIFVESLSDIERNVDTLINAIHSDSQDRQKFADWVKAGAVFYPYQFGRIIAFAPSRFIGYKDNSRENHERLIANRTADGKDTNPVISKIVGSKNAHDTRLEQAFQRYCSLIGVEPYNKKRSFWTSSRIVHAFNSQFSAIDDIDETEVGNDSPEYRRRMAGSYVRDQEVRKQVLKRANGVCEYGGCVTFKKENGHTYLEAHHVISLSEQGVDKHSNVIALCPNHHREAHFGEKWQMLQDEFIQMLKKLAS